MQVTDTATRSSQERLVTRMEQPDNRQPLAQLTFAISGDLRFISHRDTMRMFIRALIRAEVPVAYTRGFNPHLRLSLLLPRPVGMATEGDIAIVKLTSEFDGTAMVERLNAVLPAGATTTHAVCLPSLTKPQLAAADYEVLVDADGALPGRIDDLMKRDACIVERPAQGRKPTTRVDIRPLLESLALQNERLLVRARCVEGRTLALRDLCEGLQLQWTELRHRTIRKRIELV